MSEEKKKHIKTGVEADAMTQEIIKRDHKFYRLNPNFHLDLKTLHIIAQKPNNVNPMAFDLKKRELNVDQNIRNKIKDEYFKTPNQKFKYPLTMSQEIGWESSEGLNTGKRKAKKSCGETKYADYYYGLNGKSPYSTKDLSKKNDADANRK